MGLLYKMVYIYIYIYMTYTCVYTHTHTHTYISLYSNPISGSHYLNENANM